MRKFYQLTNKSFELEGVASYKELWEKVSGDHEAISVKLFTVFEKALDGGESGKYHATFSTPTEDRHGEIVYQKFDLKNFKKNPVYLDSHNYGSIEHILGRISGLKEKTPDGKEKLHGDIIFALANPKGVLAMQLADGGFLNTSSIGFIPKAFDEKGNILESELLEISAVSVPANPEALFEKIVKEMGEAKAADPADDDDEEEEETVASGETPPEVTENPDDPEPPQSVTPDRVDPVEPAIDKTIRDPKKVAAKIIRGLAEEQRAKIKKIAIVIDSITGNERHKRKAFKIIRSMIKEDTSA